MPLLARYVTKAIKSVAEVLRSVQNRNYAVQNLTQGPIGASFATLTLSPCMVWGVMKVRMEVSGMVRRSKHDYLRITWHRD